MFNIKKNTKTKESMVCDYYTVRWKEEKQTVTFTEFLEIVNECDLTIVSLKLKRVINFEGIEYLQLSFGLKGTPTNQIRFRDLCLVDRRLDYLRELGEGF